MFSILKKYMNLIVLLTFFIIILFISDLLSMWLFYELMTILMVIYMNLSNFSKFASLYYFMVSVLSSILFFFSVYLQASMKMEGPLIDVCIQLALMMKLGLFPFHQWMIYMYHFMSWKEIFYMSTVMKFIPIYFLMNLSSLNSSFFFLMFFNLIYISFVMKKFSSLKMFISCSSIIQTSFMMLLVFLNFKYFMFYFLFYVFMLDFLLKFFMKGNINNFEDLNFKIMSKKTKFLFFFGVLIYSSLPPFSSFIIKLTFNFCFLGQVLTYNLILLINLLMVVLVIWNYFSIFKFFMNYSSTKKKFFFKDFSLSVMSLVVVNVFIFAFLFINLL